jgi:hypothetical protein
MRFTRLLAGSAMAAGVVMFTAPIASASSGTTLPYRNPLRSIQSLKSGRIDQGVDYSGSGPVYALGTGTVLNRFNQGWPGGAFISYRLANGPAAGYVVYVAENVTPQVARGQHVTSQTVLGTLHNAYPNMEIGWSANAGTGYAMCHRGYIEGHSTVCGLNMNKLLVDLGTPSGYKQSGRVTGHLPPGFPTW